jgi:hypothetical protein
MALDNQDNPRAGRFYVIYQPGGLQLPQVERIKGRYPPVPGGHRQNQVVIPSAVRALRPFISFTAQFKFDNTLQVDYSKSVDAHTVTLNALLHSAR